MMIGFDTMVEAGYGPDRDMVFSSEFHADLQNGFGTSISIYQNLHRIKEYTPFHEIFYRTSPRFTPEGAFQLLYYPEERKGARVGLSNKKGQNQLPLPLHLNPLRPSLVIKGVGGIMTYSPDIHESNWPPSFLHPWPG